MPGNEQHEEEYSFYNLFVPLTTKKAIFIIALVGFIVFFNMLFNGFVGDDNIYIINYPPAHVINLSNAFGPSLFNTAGQYRPIPAFYFAILYTLFGTTTFFYHFLQLLLHIICAVLLFILFKKFFSPGISLFSALIFLCHPIQVESVSYISQAVSPLFFLFGIIAFLLSMRKNISLKILVIMCFLLLLSLLTKETGMLFVFLIVVYSFLFVRKNIVQFLIVSSFSVILYSFFRFFVGHVGFETRLFTPIASLSLPQRLLNIPIIIFYYFKTIVFPSALAYDQQWVITSLNFTNFYLPLFIDSLVIILICLAGLFIYKSHKHTMKLYLFFCAWFFSGLFMIIQLYPLDATVADRWFYFPIVGLLGIIGVFIESIKKRFIHMQKAGLIFAAIILILLCLRTMVRNSNWTDEITLFSHDLKLEDNSNLDENLGNALIVAHRYNEAITYLAKSVKVSPHANNLYDLGYAYEQLHDYKNAEYYYTLGMNQTDLSYGQSDVIKYIYAGLARIMVLNDNPKTTKVFLSKAIKKYPNDGSYWAYMAIIDYRLGNQNEALKEAGKAKNLLHTISANILYDRILNKQPLNLRAQ